MEKKFLKISIYFILLYFYFLQFFSFTLFFIPTKRTLNENKKKFFCELKSIKHASSSKFHELDHPFFFRHIVFRALLKKRWQILLVSVYGPKINLQCSLELGSTLWASTSLAVQFHIQNTSYSLYLKDFHFETSRINEFIGNFYLLLLFTQLQTPPQKQYYMSFQVSVSIHLLSFHFLIYLFL